MDREDIKKRMVAIILPYSAHESFRNQEGICDMTKYDYSEFENEHKTYRFNEISDSYRYIGDEMNAHHLTTSWHYDNMLIKEEEMLNFGYNPDDFFLIEKKLYEGDFSFLMPKKNKRFMTTTIIYDDEYLNTYTNFCLEFNELCNVRCEFAPDSEYHKLFRFSHQPCIIENLCENNGRTLLLTGDSHSIPSLPILFYYYKKVIYVDNRYMINFTDWFIGDEKIDDVFGIFWERRPISYYLEENLT